MSYPIWDSSASAQTLSETQRVVDAEDFCRNRKHLVIGFSDQVCLWAKATGRRAVFAEGEMRSAADRKDFSDVRAAVHAVMAQPSEKQFLVCFFG